MVRFDGSPLRRYSSRRGVEQRQLVGLITRRSAVRIRPPQPHSERETRSKDRVSSSPGGAQITFRSHSVVCRGAKDCPRAGLERHLGHEMVAQITQPPPEATPSRHRRNALGKSKAANGAALLFTQFPTY